MATLLQIGCRVINLDLVFEIEDCDDYLRVFYAVSAHDIVGAYSDFHAAEAELLRAWLAGNVPQLQPSESSVPAQLRAPDSTSPT